MGKKTINETIYSMSTSIVKECGTPCAMGGSIVKGYGTLRPTGTPLKKRGIEKILYTLLFIPFLALAQSQDQNYVKSTTYKQATTTAISNPSIEQANVQISYFDGLGRPIQQVDHKQAANGKDIVTHMEYDDWGRQTKDYLPFTRTASLTYTDANSVLTAINGFYATYNGGTSNPFSEKLLESSPLNRVLKQAAPGDTWAMNSGHEIEFDYQTNVQNTDKVRIFTASTNWNPTLNIYDIALEQNQGFYSTGKLYKTITKDENHSGTTKNYTTEEFKNKEGQVVLKRTYEDSVPHDTYYVYDMYGNLTYVIPPKVATVSGGNPRTITTNNASSTDDLPSLCYQYKYDSRNRLVEKKLPGKDWEFIVYDKLDRPIATGPAFSPFGDATIGWMITKYDAFNRPILTAWQAGSVNTTTRKDIQEARNAQTSNFNETKTTASTTINNVAFRYSNVAYPTTSYHVLTINYYDDYLFPHAGLMDTNVPGATLATNVKGLPTGSWVRVLESASDTNAELSYVLYDTKYRPVSNYTKNHLGGYTRVDTSLDWAGKVLQTVTKHKRTSSDNENTITETFTYTPQDRLLTHKHQINSQAEETLTENSYDELGQLILKTTGGGLQDVDYRYNVRGWLTAINDEELAVSNDGFVNPGEGDLFAFKISYDDVLNPLGNTTALYNGNIAETFWKTSTDNAERQYGYEYDALNRLTKANFIKDPFYGGDEVDMFNETLMYDPNGNITFLDRMGKIQSDSQPIDQLVYTYDGNQLKKVRDDSNSPQGFNDGVDEAEEYSYDPNGNMVFDKNKGIQLIKYNHLNLPTQILFENNNNIEYLYNAVGQKVKKSVKTGEEYADTDYLSGFQYRSSYTSAQGDQSEATLQYFPHAEGYVQHVDGEFFYVYNYTDHLGNIRLSYTFDYASGLIKIMEENHYYPFGLKHDSYNTNRLGYSSYIDEEEISHIVLGDMPKFVGDGSYSYLYNSKEYQDELGLNMYDYGARNYDPALGRWMNIDPLAEKYYEFSPYTYAVNNPIYFIDPNGMEVTSGGWGTTYTGLDAQNAFQSLKNQMGDSDEENPIYGSDGQFRGVDEFGMKGEAIVYNGMFENGMSQTDILTNGGNFLGYYFMMNCYKMGQVEDFESKMKSSYQAYAMAQVLQPEIVFTIGSIGSIGSLSPSAEASTISSTGGRVFWSGGEVAKGAAAEFAAINGMKTLEMTTAGNIMNTLSPYLPRAVSNPIWNRLSQNFASGASGKVNFFTTFAGPRPTSIWLNVEKPILQSNGVKIIENVIK